MNNITRVVVAVLVGIASGVARFLCESSMPALVPYDAQGGIWVAYGLVMGGGTFLLVTLFCFLALRFFGEHMAIWGWACILPLLLIGGCTAGRTIELRHIRQALVEAQDPTTDQTRLRALVGYQTGFGYEIDNRIASNPNTPIDVLRSLHNKLNQVGTEMSLARNPNTPNDILLDLASRTDKWSELIQKSLAMNPRYEEIMGPTTGSSVRLPRRGATATDP